MGLRKIQKSLVGFLLASLFIGLVPVAEAGLFSDVPASHPQAEAIDYLVREGIIGGYPDGTFGPSRSVNRAEALKIMLLSSGFEPPAVSTARFSDVPTTAWFAGFVELAVQKKVVAGYPDGQFRPERPVNLVEALKMLLLANGTTLDNYATTNQLFADTQSSAWYNPFLSYAQHWQLIESDNQNRVQPSTPLTRAQLAQIIYRHRTRVEQVCPRLLENSKEIDSDFFASVLLEPALPNVFFEDEVVTVRGSLTTAADQATVFLVDANGAQSYFRAATSGQSFAIPVAFGQVGFYRLSVLPGTSGRSFVTNIEVLPRECAPATVASAAPQSSPGSFALRDNDPLVSWPATDANLFRVLLRQGEHRFEKLVTAGAHELVLDPANFADWSGGAATLQVFAARSEHGWSYEPRTDWAAGPISTLQLSQHHFSTVRSELKLDSTLPTFASTSLNFSGSASVPLEPTAYTINPNGSVSEYRLTNQSEVASSSRFTWSLTMDPTRTTIVELNDTTGLAVLNHPLYAVGTAPLLPDFEDLRIEPDPARTISPNAERSIWLGLLNTARAEQGLSAVRLDSEIIDFAQEYAERMARENFFGHADPSGADPEARRKTFGLPLPVSENLALDSTTAHAHSGLMRSAGHRANILDPRWTRVGLGIARNAKGELIFVQEFSAELLTSENLPELRSQLLQIINTKRNSQGLAPLVISSKLAETAQAWAEKTVIADQLEFAIGNESLELAVRATGFTSSFGAFLAADSDTQGVAESLFVDGDVLGSSRSQVAIGLSQGSDGLLRAVFIYH